MSYESELERIKQEIIDNLPPEIHVQEIEFEGPEIAVYSENSSDLDSVDNSTLIKGRILVKQKHILEIWLEKKPKFQQSNLIIRGVKL